MPCTDHCIAWKKTENHPPQGTPTSIPLDALLQTDTLFSDVLFREGLEQRAWGRGKESSRWLSGSARVIRGREHTCHCYNRHIGDWEQAPCAPRGAGVYQVPPTLQFPHPWGQRATALPSGSGWDVTVIITTVADLRFAPPDAASALSCFPPRGLPCVGGPPGTPLPPHSLIGEPHSRREEAGQGVPSPSRSLQGLR